MIPNNTSCIRGGVLDPGTPVSVIVKGDIVHVKAGDVVPADIRIIDSKAFKVNHQIHFIYLIIFSHQQINLRSNLQVDNSSLTGESVAVPRSNIDGTPNILESPNVAFFSTQCVEGWAIGKANQRQTSYPF